MTTNCRQLAMLIWLQVGTSNHIADCMVPKRPTDVWQVPNIPSPSKEDNKAKDKSPSPVHAPSTGDPGSKAVLSDGFDINPTSTETPVQHPVRNWHKKGSHPPSHTEQLFIAEGSGNRSADDPPDSERKEREVSEGSDERAILQGMIEKKTYIGLVSWGVNIRCELIIDSCVGPSLRGSHET
jgi:hypothetical protein